MSAFNFRFFGQLKIMNLVNDLETEIAFAILTERKHSEKIASNDVLPLIGRFNTALKQISESEKEAIDLIAENDPPPQTAFS